MDAAVRYLEALGRHVGGGNGDDRRADIVAAMDAIRTREQVLARQLLAALRDAGATIYGIADLAAVADRVPTVCFNFPGKHPALVADAMGRAQIGIRDGHMYAPRLMGRLGLSMDRGAIRVSLVHYNTEAEIERFAEALPGVLAQA